jgi:hypothetical protein
MMTMQFYFNGKRGKKVENSKRKEEERKMCLRSDARSPLHNRLFDEMHLNQQTKSETKRFQSNTEYIPTQTRL